MSKTSWAVAIATSLALGASLAPDDAQACGGFFCSQAQGVNQAAERIVFANNGDGTVTAVIEIQYQGPADEFSWLLPLSSVPQGDQIAVGSSLSLQRLQLATNPQYQLTTRIEGRCDEDEDDFAGGVASGGEASFGEGGSGSLGPGSSVTVEASGVVGSFEWAVISLDQALPEPADAAVEWLNANGYDVPQGAPGLLKPYLLDGMYLLALKLVKGADAGSIRPIVLTYEATRPMIPIKLTAVAANDDMGVLTWVLSDAQAVPKNYYALELNEARINWFNPNSNYNDVVIAAANEASGQGFVTEYAQSGESLANQIWFDFEQQGWVAFKARAVGRDPAQVVVDAMFEYSQWDGFWDVFREHVTLSPNVTLKDVQNCSDFSGGGGGGGECHAEDMTVSPDFMTALETDVIEPAQVVQKLLDTHPYVTRLYSTLSAAEMTVDPLFTYNPDLEPVSNLHTAERIIECASGYYEFEAPWRIELPQGAVVRGGPDDFGNWPAEFDDQPANRRILRQGENGAGRVYEDNSAIIDDDVMAYSDSVPTPPRRVDVPSGRGTELNPDGSPAAPGEVSGSELEASGGCACRTSSGSGSLALVPSLLGLAALLRRRRRAR